MSLLVKKVGNILIKTTIEIIGSVITAYFINTVTKKTSKKTKR